MYNNNNELSILNTEFLVHNSCTSLVIAIYMLNFNTAVAYLMHKIGNILVHSFLSFFFSLAKLNNTILYLLCIICLT